MADNYLDEDESKEEIEFQDDILNYRGYFIENEEEEEKKFYEYGAHFPYMFLYQRLEIIQQEREKNQKELEKKLKEKENNNKQSRDDPATNEESKPNENLKDLLNIFQQKGKSRNRGDVDIGLTYMPQMKKDKEEQLNPLEHFAAGLIKSTAGKKDEGKTKNKIIKNIKKNNVLKKDELIGANSKYNNYMNKNEKILNKKGTKKILSGNQQKKIRKRNENKIWNINNSLNGNITISLNLLNKTKFGEKNNPKNMTHDIPYMTKITNNLVNKLKSIQYSKEKLRQQILKTNAEQNLLKKAKANKIINKFRNINNKGSYSNNYGYQNTKNTSSSKNMINNKKKAKINKIGISSNTNLMKEKSDKKNINNIKNNIIGNNLLNNNNNNNKLIKQNNFLNNLKNSNKTKNITNINKNLIKINNNITSKNNNISNNNNNSQNNNKNKIPNNNYKNILLKKENIKSSTLNRNTQFEFIESLGNNKSKNNISRNNNAPIFNNQIQSITNKNFHSVNNPNKKIINSRVKIPNHVNINLTNNFSNLNQQIKTQKINKAKDLSYKYNNISSSNTNLNKQSPRKITQKKNPDINNNKKVVDIQKKKNINNIKEKLQNYLFKVNNIKSNISTNKTKKCVNKSTFKNNAFTNLENNLNIKKNNISRNRAENNEINLEKLTAKKNNTLMQNKKKHNININININNQQNIILNKLGNGAGNNSINICSVRSSDNKEINNKNDKNQSNEANYFI